MSPSFSGGSYRVVGGFDSKPGWRERLVVFGFGGVSLKLGRAGDNGGVAGIVGKSGNRNQDQQAQRRHNAAARARTRNGSTLGGAADSETQRRLPKIRAWPRFPRKLRTAGYSERMPLGALVIPWSYCLPRLPLHTIQSNYRSQEQVARTTASRIAAIGPQSGAGPLRCVIVRLCVFRSPGWPLCVHRRGEAKSLRTYCTPSPAGKRVALVHRFPAHCARSARSRSGSVAAAFWQSALALANIWVEYIGHIRTPICEYHAENFDFFIVLS